MPNSSAGPLLHRLRAATVRLDVTARFRVRDFRGLPPSIPFARDDAAFRLDLTEPRHAGQNETRLMR